MATGLENLKIYKMAEELEIEVNELTKKFPKDKRYRSIDQLKRSSAAVANNIAEFYNKQSTKEKIHILRDIAKSEAEETKHNLLRSARKGFIGSKEVNLLVDRYTELIKAISGYIKFLKAKTL